MRIRRATTRRSKEINGALCATCRVVCAVTGVETQAETTIFTLTCGHTVLLTPGALCTLDVNADTIILYPNRADLLARQGGTA